MITGCTLSSSFKNETSSKNLKLQTGYFFSALTFDSVYLKNLKKMDLNGSLELCNSEDCVTVGKISGDIIKTAGFTTKIGASNIEPGLYQLKVKLNNVHVERFSGGGSSGTNLPATESIVGAVTISQDQTTLVELNFNENSFSQINSEQTAEFKTILINADTVKEEPVRIEDQTYIGLFINGKIDTIMDTRTNARGISQSNVISLPFKDQIAIDIKDESDLSAATLITTEGRIETIVVTKPIQIAIEDILEHVSTDTNIPINQLATTTDISVIDDQIEKDEREILIDEQTIIQSLNNVALTTSQQAVAKDEQQLLLDIKTSEQLIDQDASLTTSEKTQIDTELNLLLSSTINKLQIDEDISVIETKIIPKISSTAEKQFLQTVEQDFRIIEKDEQTVIVDSKLLYEAEAKLSADEERLKQDKQRLETIINTALSVPSSTVIKGTETTLETTEKIIIQEERIIETSIQSGNIVEVFPSASAGINIESSISSSGSDDSGSSSSSSDSISVGI